MSLKAFGEMIGRFAFNGQRIGKAIAERLDVPYYADRETGDNWPDNFNKAGEAVAKLPHGITGIYFHIPSLNLILLGPLGEKVGIRSTRLASHMPDLDRLLELKKAATS